MKPSHLMYAKSNSEGVVVIEGLGKNKIRIVGSSVARVIPSDDYVNSAVLSIAKGDKGLIAINAVDHSGKHAEYFSFFLKIEWNEVDVLPFIDLDSQWMPRHPERLGAFAGSGIRTEIDGLVFTSNKYDIMFDKLPNMRYVSEHNLLCKYLAGDIEADVVEKTAAERIDEENARLKLPELEKKIQELTALVAEKEKLLAKMEELVLAEKKSAEKYYQQEMRVYERLNAASKVIKEMEKQWFHRPSIKKALQNCKAVMMRE